MKNKIIILLIPFCICSCWHKEGFHIMSEAVKYILEDNNGKTKPDVQDIISTYGKIQKVELTNKQVSNIVGYSIIPAKNCIGKNTIRINETFTKSITTEFNIGGSAQLETPAIQLISIGIGMQFGITKGTTIERSLSFEVDVNPNSNTEYKLAWKEIWQSGIVTIEKTGGKIETIPFEIKSGIEYQIFEVKELNCK
ncbi:MAG: hypothetical protein HUU01_10900 [Saprospiraceae bacterium]|nr:hypothetical protein [Saprospiraceae bacterium]